MSRNGRADDDQAAPLGVLEHESHGPARPTLTRVVPRTARANKGLSHNSYGPHGVATLMSGERVTDLSPARDPVIRLVIRCK